MEENGDENTIGNLSNEGSKLIELQLNKESGRKNKWEDRLSTIQFLNSVDDSNYKKQFRQF